MNIFQGKNKKNSYSNYAVSNNARIEQNLIFEKLYPLLPKNPEIKILDAACGNGWLLGKLSKTYKKLYGFDLSATLMESAKNKFPKINYNSADLLKPLPYNKNTFDTILFIMAAHDVGHLKTALKNLSEILKPEGQMLLAVANPYYSFPVGVWKRGLKKILPKARPELKLRAYNQIKRNKNRSFVWNKDIISYFHTLPEYINTALSVKLQLTAIEEITSEIDTDKFSREHQLYRFPLILLLEFKKLSK